MTLVVASGKGGTGKTTVSVGMAQSLAGEVTLLDCDVEGPNTQLFLHDEASQSRERFTVPMPEVDPARCTGCGACAEFCRFGALAVVRRKVLFFEDLCHACGGCTRVCPEGAITEVPHGIGTITQRSAPGAAGATQGQPSRAIAGELDVGQTLAPPVINAVKERARPEAETIVIDAAPGATCPMVEAARGADAGVLVTENTPFGLHDLAAAAEVFRELRLPAGIVVNRSGIGFRDESELQQISDRFGFPVLLRIPFSEEVARACAEGRSIVEAMPTLRSQFRALHARLADLAEGAAI